MRDSLMDWCSEELFGALELVGKRWLAASLFLYNCGRNCGRADVQARRICSLYCNLVLSRGQLFLRGARLGAHYKTQRADCGGLACHRDVPPRSPMAGATNCGFLPVVLFCFLSRARIAATDRMSGHLLRHLLLRLANPNNADSLEARHFALAVICTLWPLSLLCGWQSWRLVERPFLKLKKWGDKI